MSASHLGGDLWNFTPISNVFIRTGQTNDIDDDQWILWAKIVNDWDDYKKKNGKILKVILFFIRWQ